MAYVHFQPHPTGERPCWHCVHYDTLVFQGTAATCCLPAGPRVRSMPERGCSAWQREVGSDDEPAQRPVTIA